MFNLWQPWSIDCGFDFERQFIHSISQYLIINPIVTAFAYTVV